MATHRPYYLAWYNPLLGGGPVASRWLPVGWGEGMDRAADFLDGLPRAPMLTVATPSVALLAPLASARVVPAREWATADYLVLYVDDVQIGQPQAVADWRDAATPIRVVRLFGIDYAWVYDRRDLPGSPAP